MIRLAFFLFLSMVFLVSCPQACEHFMGSELKTIHMDFTTTSSSMDPLRDAVESLNSFSVKLLRTINFTGPGIALSPISIVEAVSMAYLGARGDTKRVMEIALSIPKDTNLPENLGKLVHELEKEAKEQDLSLDIKSALWVQKGFRLLKSFMENVKRCYGTTPKSLDFVGRPMAAVDTINQWIKESTRNKIISLISREDVDKRTRLLITNAIYFKGIWKEEFKKKDTKISPFHLGRTKTIRVPMMHRKGAFMYAELPNGSKILGIPFKGGSFELLILLPKSPGEEENLIRNMDWKTLSEWIGSMRKKRVSVFIPRFKVDVKSCLNGPLSRLGMDLAFSDGADFSGITGRKDLKISKIIHRSYVEVNEKGAEAAGATGVIMKVTSFMPEEEKVFRADHPFIFFIIHRGSGAILFLGVIKNPLQEFNP